MSASGPAIAVENLGKCYHMYARPEDRLKQAAFRWSRRFYSEFWALRGVTFEIARGESFGIVGRNGSGKSTLLQIVAGTTAPTEGVVRRAGRVAALLELGSGFDPEFTGRENVYLNGAILGLTRRQVDERFDAIAAFADIGQFIDQPVKTYSSGMLVRLAFAVQVQVEPDILIVDEALAVGDNLFQKRCYQRLHELRERGVTLLFVSHDQETIRTLTGRALLLHAGRVRAIGPSSEVLLDYRRLLHEEESRWMRSEAARAQAPRIETRADEPPTPDDDDLSRRSFGDLDAEILGVQVLDGAGEPCAAFRPGETLVIRVRYRVNREMTGISVGVRIRDKQGVKIYSWGTLNQDMALWAGRARGDVLWDRRLPAGHTEEIDFVCDCPLGANFYEVQASVSEERDRHYNDQRILHWIDEAAFFSVLVDRHEYFFGGVADLRMRAHVRH